MARNTSRWMSTDKLGPAPLVKADRLVIVTSHLARMKALRGRQEELRNTGIWLLQQEHQSERIAVAPNDEEDEVEHTPILLLEPTALGVTKGLMSARRKEIGTTPSLQSQHMPHVKASMHARHKRRAEVNADGDLAVDTLVLHSANSCVLATANGDGRSMFACEEPSELV